MKTPNEEPKGCATDAQNLLARRRNLKGQRDQLNFEIAEIDRRLLDLRAHDARFWPIES